MLCPYDQWKLASPPWWDDEPPCDICGLQGGDSGSENLEQNQQDIEDPSDDRLLCESCIESVNEQYQESRDGRIIPCN